MDTEFLGRAGIVLYFSVAIILNVVSIVDLIGNPSPPANWLLQLLSQLATQVFLCLIIVMAAIRLKPSRGARGIEPRVTAMVGSYLMVALFMMVKTDPPSAAVAVIGLCFVVLGSVLSAYVLVWLGRSYSIMAEARRLVTGGPYSIVRHPLYVTEAITVAGVVLLNWSLPAVLFFGAQWCLQLRRMRNEEQVLKAAFPEYAEYASRTPRWLPAFPGWKRQPV